MALFALLYAGFGAQSPFLPALLSSRGLSSQTIGFVIAIGGIVRLVETPLLANRADRTASVRTTLALACAASAGAALLYLKGAEGAALVATAIVQAAALAPTASFADAIALSAAETRGFAYGAVRGVGSAAFVAATLAAGALANAFGWIVGSLSQALLLGLATPAAMLVPEPADRRVEAPASWRELLHIAPFRSVIVIAALALGSHALHDGFAIIYWTQAGVSPRMAGVLWSESVVAEVAVFLVIGPRLIGAVGERRALLLALGAAIVRWCIMGRTGAAAVMAFTEPLHGLSFALLHLACMSVIGRVVPASLAASAQAIYGAVGVGLANVAMSAASGWLFARFGGHAFWFMAALCLPAAPVVLLLPASTRDMPGR